jgi:protein-S-isoprenylcysteine O-methyltransferase Ste14
MRNETRFRLVFSTLGILGVLIRMYYIRRANESGKRISKSREERLRMALLASCNVQGVITGLLYVIAPRRIRWAAVPVPPWSRWAGAALGMVTLPLLLWTHHALGKNWTAPLEIKEQHTLITSGPYGWVRHPMYTTFFLNGLVTFLVSANWLVGLGWIGQSIVAASRVGEEEALMIEEFGDEYRAYMQRTGRFLPPLTLNRV